MKTFYSVVKFECLNIFQIYSFFPCRREHACSILFPYYTSSTTTPLQAVKQDQQNLIKLTDSQQKSLTYDIHSDKRCFRLLKVSYVVASAQFCIRQLSFTYCAYIVVLNNILYLKGTESYLLVSPH